MVQQLGDNYPIISLNLRKFVLNHQHCNDGVKTSYYVGLMNWLDFLQVKLVN